MSCVSSSENYKKKRKECSYSVFIFKTLVASSKTLGSLHGDGCISVCSWEDYFSFKNHACIPRYYFKLFVAPLSPKGSCCELCPYSIWSLHFSLSYRETFLLHFYIPMKKVEPHDGPILTPCIIHVDKRKTTEHDTHCILRWPIVS